MSVTDNFAPLHPPRNQAFINHRVGRFTVTFEMVSDEHIKKLMAMVVVVRCELKYSSSSLHYEAFSDDFDPVDLKNEPPDYDAIFDAYEGTWKFERRT